MNLFTSVKVEQSDYDCSQCDIGIVHLGFGAFHRAHFAVYIDDYMQTAGDLKWGIAAVNLRKEEAEQFAKHNVDQDGYVLKTTTPGGENAYRKVRSHVGFEDWSIDRDKAEKLLCEKNTKIVSMTVTESGYYLNDDWSLNLADPVLKSEIENGEAHSVYAFLASALNKRKDAIDEPITIVCCDNIRSNGELLGKNFKAYLKLTGKDELAKWLDEKATFPNSMVDRITPRATQELQTEISAIVPDHKSTAVHGESFIQWVLENNFATDFPSLDTAGVEIVEDVHPYEEAKIRILNGGHTALCYLGALAGYQTFDQAMDDPKLREHFDQFERENVIPGLTIDLPFDKQEYCDQIAERFSNSAIADDLARICMDGWSKFPIFIRPTVKSCLAQGISPKYGYDSIASWYVYARRFANGTMPIPYVDPYWEQLKPLLETGKENEFANLEALWSDLPKKYDEFVPNLISAIKKMEEQWPA